MYFIVLRSSTPKEIKLESNCVWNKLENVLKKKTNSECEKPESKFYGTNV